jgi:hypothetical protein
MSTTTGVKITKEELKSKSIIRDEEESIEGMEKTEDAAELLEALSTPIPENTRRPSPSPREEVKRLEKAINISEWNYLGLLERKYELMELTDAKEKDVNKLDQEIKKTKLGTENMKERMEILKRLLGEDEELEVSNKVEKIPRAVVPQGLAKFRQPSGIYEPEDFLESFERILTAHQIVLEEYRRLIPLCLDSVDSLWFKNHIAVYRERDWERFRLDFIQHFRYPNGRFIGRTRYES